MINIGEISKPSVPAKTSGTNKRAKKVQGSSPIDATRKVNSSTRDDHSRQAKEQKAQHKRALEQSQKDDKESDSDATRSENNDSKTKHIDISV